MINSYDFGRIVIDGNAFTTDVIIFPDRVDAEWNGGGKTDMFST